MAATTIFVGDLSYFCEEKDLLGIFSSFGPVSSVIVRRGKEGNSLQYAFVIMEDADAHAACDSLNGRKFMGRTLRMNISTSQKQRCTPLDRSIWFQLHVRFKINTLSLQLNEMLIEDIFSQYGPVADCTVKEYNVNMDLRTVSGYAFVYYYTVEEANLAIQMVNQNTGYLSDAIHFRCNFAYEVQEGGNDDFDTYRFPTAYNEVSHPSHRVPPQPRYDPRLPPYDGYDDRASPYASHPGIRPPPSRAPAAPAYAAGPSPGSRHRSYPPPPIDPRYPPVAYDPRSTSHYRVEGPGYVDDSPGSSYHHGLYAADSRPLPPPAAIDPRDRYAALGSRDRYPPVDPRDSRYPPAAVDPRDIRDPRDPRYYTAPVADPRSDPRSDPRYYPRSAGGAPAPYAVPPKHSRGALPPPSASYATYRDNRTLAYDPMRAQPHDRYPGSSQVGGRHSAQSLPPTHIHGYAPPVSSYRPGHPDYDDIDMHDRLPPKATSPTSSYSSLYPPPSHTTHPAHPGPSHSSAHSFSLFSGSSSDDFREKVGLDFNQSAQHTHNTNNASSNSMNNHHSGHGDILSTASLMSASTTSSYPQQQSASHYPHSQDKLIEDEDPRNSKSRNISNNSALSLLDHVGHGPVGSAVNADGAAAIEDHGMAGVPPPQSYDASSGAVTAVSGSSDIVTGENASNENVESLNRQDRRAVAEEAAIQYGASEDGNSNADAVTGSLDD